MFTDDLHSLADELPHTKRGHVTVTLTHENFDELDIDEPYDVVDETEEFTQVTIYLH